MDKKEMSARLKKGEDPLELAIEKWQDIVEGKGKEEGWQNCALCARYGNSVCQGCPVSATGHMVCERTPYTEYTKAVEQKASKEILLKIARKEVEFLKSLRQM